MPATLYKRKKNVRDNVSDDSLITLISNLVNKEPKFQSIQKGIWLWNRTDKCFQCSGGFRELMTVSILAIPDLDFWVEKLSSDALVKFTDALEGVINNSKTHAFIFKTINQNSEQKLIQCFMENMKCSTGKNYIIGVFCDISEQIFSEQQN